MHRRVQNPLMKQLQRCLHTLPLFRHGTLFTFLLLQPFSASLQERGARALFALMCSNAALFQAKVCVRARVRSAAALLCVLELNTLPPVSTCACAVRLRGSFLMPRVLRTTA